jgi:ElaB/YqjD/DUF883 family membrane-anchored ribosome-binding protein
METLVDKASQSAHDVVDKIANVSHQAADTFNEKTGQLKTAEQHLVDNCRGYIHDNPVATIGIAVAAGFLFSRLLSSR